jgi:DNA-directed RNA polymerase specialized sigma subunit
MDLEDKIHAEVTKLMALKEQIREVIDEVADTDERMVLRYRYIHNLTWEQIGDELHADRTTVYRWHNSAVNHVKLPENPIQI